MALAALPPAPSRARPLKTFKNLFSHITGFENLYLAYRAARKGKRGKPPAASFELQLYQAQVKNLSGVEALAGFAWPG
jgi:hypothetical protein